jgi:iron complex outermembrane recepter protein
MTQPSTRIVRALLLGVSAALTFDHVALGQATQGVPNDANSLQEIVVTATKRSEAVRSISGSVTALTGHELEQLGAQSMEDYLTRSPGVVFNAATPGLSSVAIRGVSTTTGIDQGQGTTGYFINDVPLSDPYFSVAIPDIDTFDVDNVTVLRGPQGTLFGSASLGGAVNYQTSQPNLSEYQMHVQGTVEGTAQGGSGGSGKIMVNVPIINEVFALRGVYVYRTDPGYIRNIGTGEKDVNSTLIRGGRIEALWTPTATTKISYLFLQQSEDTPDLGYQEPDYAGALKKNTVAPETNDYTTLIHNMRLDQELSFATLTVTAAYHEKTSYAVQDATQALSSLLPGVSPITIITPATSRGTTYEARLASPADRRFEYLVGIMHDETRLNEDTLAEGPGAAQSIEAVFGPIFGAGIGQASAPGDVFLTAQIPVKAQESAAFGEATFHFNDQWKITLGGRAFETKVTNETTSSGFITLLTTGALTSDVSGSQKESGFLPKGSITWTPNKDLMTYFLVDQGFRFGGPNLSPSEPGFPIPPQFKSDSLINYELGVRSSFLDQHLLLDGTVFHIDWSDIQLRLQTDLGLNYAANAGKATISGFEGSATWLITQGFTLSSSLTYLDAKLASPFEPGGGQPTVPSGSTLPGASKWQVANTLSYNWFNAPFKPSLVLADRYISEAPGIFLSGLPQGDYNLLDARVSLHVKEVGITAFVNNMTDRRGITNANDLPPVQEFLVRPRTVGLTLDYRW